MLKVKVLKVPESLSSCLSSKLLPSRTMGVYPLERAINKTFSYKAKRSQDMDTETKEAPEDWMLAPTPWKPPGCRQNSGTLLWRPVSPHGKTQQGRQAPDPDIWFKWSSKHLVIVREKNHFQLIILYSSLWLFKYRTRTRHFQTHTVSFLSPCAPFLGKW